VRVVCGKRDWRRRRRRKW